MRKVIRLIAFGFLTAGVVAGLCAVGVVLSTWKFLDDSITATAEVVDFQERASDDSVVYAPVFRFETESGQVATFIGQSASYPPAYRVGERAEIAYRRSSYHDARDTSFYSLWGVALTFGALGSVFAGIGGCMLGHAYLKAKRDATLRRTGTAVRAYFQNVELNHALAVNGRHPWRIVAQWKDPASGMLHLFHSDDIWFDPTRHITSEEIIVYVDPEKPRRYCMDLSFLPTLAE